MNEEYLWNKTGGDAEIEKLENALKTFRSTKTIPPVLPAPAIRIETARRSIFDWRFVFAAAFGIVAICFGLFLISSNFKSATPETAAINTPQDSARKTVEQTSPVEIAAETKTEKIAAPKFVKILNPIRQTSLANAKVNRKTIQKPRLVKKIPSREPIEMPAETLTAEEKYAYRQLMLALSITGSKLKIINDKIQGIDRRNSVSDAAR